MQPEASNTNSSPPSCGSRPEGSEPGSSRQKATSKERLDAQTGPPENQAACQSRPAAPRSGAVLLCAAQSPSESQSTLKLFLERKNFFQDFLNQSRSSDVFSTYLPFGNSFPSHFILVFSFCSLFFLL